MKIQGDYKLPSTLTFRDIDSDTVFCYTSPHGVQEIYLKVCNDTRTNAVCLNNGLPAWFIDSDKIDHVYPYATLVLNSPK